MNSLLRHLKQKPVSGKHHPALLRQKNITTRNLIFIIFRVVCSQRTYQEASKNIKFYSHVVCFVLSGIFSMFFVDILELIDRKIVIICI